MLYEEDQKFFYDEDQQLRADIDIHLTRRFEEEPHLKECRYAALHLSNKGNGWVVYDRLLCRIVNGVFYGRHALENTLEVAQLYNDGHGSADMSPNGEALGLRYPKPLHKPIERNTSCL